MKNSNDTSWDRTSENLQMYCNILLILLESIIIFIWRIYFAVIQIKFLFYYGRMEFQIFGPINISVISELRIILGFTYFLFMCTKKEY